MSEISNDGKAIYGYKEVIQFINTGIIDTLLITDTYLRDERIKKNNQIDELIESVKKTNNNVIIFSTKFEPGIRLKGLGSIAAILKYKQR